MNKTFKVSTSIIVVLLLISIVLAAVILFTNREVDADVSATIMVEDLSTETAKVTRYTNISNYARRLSRTMSVDEVEGQICSLMDIDVSELGVSRKELTTARSVTIQDSITKVAEDGTVTQYKTQFKDFDDIVNDNGKSGYMRGRIVVLQDPSYDKAVRNKEGEVLKFYHYGFQCTFTMQWIKDPTYRMTDKFTFNADHEAFPDFDSAECKPLGSLSVINTGTGTVTGRPNDMEITKYASGKVPVFSFNLPNNGINSTYHNLGVQATARYYSNTNFNIYMAYAHKQVCVGDISVSVSTSGPISFGCSTAMRTYNSPPLWIECVTDSKLEKLK